MLAQGGGLDVGQIGLGRELERVAGHRHLAQARGRDPAQAAEVQELRCPRAPALRLSNLRRIVPPMPPKAKRNPAPEKPRGEASLRGHLKGDGKEETNAALSAYVPKEPEKDTQLKYALSFVRNQTEAAEKTDNKDTGSKPTSPAAPSSKEPGKEPGKAN